MRAAMRTRPPVEISLPDSTAKPVFSPHFILSLPVILCNALPSECQCATQSQKIVERQRSMISVVHLAARMNIAFNFS